MADYMNYGQLNNITPRQVLSNTKRYTQVYQATHDGELRLPFMRRSFISFSYGGKNIEDFNLIATVSGDMLERPGYADFEDLTSDYDVMNGQFYWSTYFHTNTFEFELSTDSMDQSQLDEFMRWFKAGQIKELILAEHPNRAILARVKDVPQISMIPFETKRQMTLDTVKYEVTTTEYKGSISLQLVSDDPFWYAKINVFGHFDASTIYSDWKNANGDEVGDLLSDPDILKIIFEDGIPLSSMVKSTIALGGSVYATVEAELRCRIADDGITQEEYEDVGGQNNTVWYGVYTDPNTAQAVYYKGAAISGPNDTIELAPGITAGAQMGNASNISQLNPYNSDEDCAFFYYPGTAPSPLSLEFDIFPKIDDETYFITTPKNQYQDILHPYNSIWIESIHKEELKLTTPNIFTSYNQVINMFNTQIGETWVQIRTLIRDTVHHPIIRAWANHIIDDIISEATDVEEGESVSVSADECTGESSLYAKEQMALLFKNPQNENETLKAHFVIDSKTGESVGTFMFRNDDNETVSEITENIQDMLLSNNLIIKDRNYFNDDGQVVQWQPNSEKTRAYSHRMYHDMATPMYNINIIYQNLYL